MVRSRGFVTSGCRCIFRNESLTPKVNKNDPVSLHDRVAAEIRRAIAEGEAVEGERLPPAVDLAAVLGVNKNTVIRALHIL